MLSIKLLIHIKTRFVLNERYSYLSNRLQVACGLQLVDSVALGLAVSGTLGNWAFAASTAHADSEDHETYRHRIV